MVRLLVIAFSTFVIDIGSLALAADPLPADAPKAAATETSAVTTPMRVQEAAGGTFVYAEREVTVREIEQVVGQLMGQVGAAVGKGEVRPTGSPVVVMRGIGRDPEQKVTVQAGFPVRDGTTAPDGLHVRELAAMRCATIVISGPQAGIPQAYRDLFGKIHEAKLRPTTEQRQLVLYWERPESPNNVVVAQVGVE